MVHHVTMLKPYQCEYDRVRTLTLMVHHTNKRRTRQCKYDRVRTQRYKQDDHTNKRRTRKALSM